jgi:hypothetical protein
VAVHVRPPVVIDPVGRPDVAVGLLVGPAAVLIEFLLILVEVGRKAAGRAPLGEQRVPRLVPLVEGVGAGIGLSGVAEQVAVCGDERLTGVDHDGAGLACGLEAALDDQDFGLALGGNVEPIKAFFQDIVRRVGRMDLDAFLTRHGADPQVRAAFEDMDLDPVVALGGQDGKLDLAVFSQPEVIPAAEMDFGLTFAGPQLVALDQNQVDLSPFGAEVRRPLDEDIAVDVVHTGEARGVIAVG